MSINNSSRIFCAKGCIGNGGSRVKKFFFFMEEITACLHALENGSIEKE